MKSFFLLFFIFPIYFLSAGNLVEKEIYYNSENQIIGEKQYFYNLNNNIIETCTLQGGKITTKKQYFYHNNKLIFSEEFAGEKTKIYYSFYFYNENINLPIKTLFYDFDERIIFYYEYIYDKERLLSVKIYNHENKIETKIDFIYENTKLIEEKTFNYENKLILKKIFYYDNNLINKIELLDPNGNKIRTIKRIYSNKTDKISYLGFRENFYDIK